MTTDEAILAYAAVKKLRALYDAHRATNQALAIVLRRIAKAKTSEPGTGASLTRLYEQAALSRRTDHAYWVRSEDLRQRLEELREEHPLP